MSSDDTHRIMMDLKGTLDWMDVGVEAWRDPDKPAGDITLYDAIKINFEMWGVDDDQAFELVETWKKR